MPIEWLEHDRKDLPTQGIEAVGQIKDQQDGQPIPDSRSGEWRDGVERHARRVGA
jgi:hypothetical protein